MAIGGKPRRSLEELVDRVMEALFASNQEESQPQTVARIVHDARRLQQAGDLDGALATLASVETTQVAKDKVRWAYAEWLGLVRRRYEDRELLVYSQGAGMAAALAPRGDGTAEVLAVLGMRWQLRKVVSAKSLRGLRSLNQGGSWSKSMVRRVTRHRIPDLVGRNSENIPGSTDLLRR